MAKKQTTAPAERPAVSGKNRGVTTFVLPERTRSLLKRLKADLGCGSVGEIITYLAEARARQVVLVLTPGEMERLQAVALRGEPVAATVLRLLRAAEVFAAKPAEEIE